MTNTNQPLTEQQIQAQVDHFIRLFFCRHDVLARMTDTQNGWEPRPYHPETYFDLENEVYLHLFKPEMKTLIGAYCPSPEGMVRWACLDIDGPSHASPAAMEPLKVFNEILNTNKLPPGYTPHLEISKSGDSIHVWFFFEDMVPAWLVREDLGFLVKEYELELFPKADRPLTKKGKLGYGNFLWLPGCLTEMDFDSVRFSNIEVREQSKKAIKEKEKKKNTGLTGRVTLPSKEGNQKQVGVKQQAGPLKAGRFAAVPDEVVGSGAKVGSGYSRDEVVRMFSFLDLEMHYDDWISILMAIKSSGFDDAKEMFIEWSSESSKWDRATFEYKWESFDKGEVDGYGVSMGTMVHHARQGGWSPVSGLTQAELDYNFERLSANAIGSGIVGLPMPASDADMDLAEALAEWFWGQGDFAYWEGSMWLYVESKGVWEPQSDRWYLDAIGQYNGTWTAVEGKKKQIRFSNSKVQGVKRLFLELVRPQDEKKPVGVRGTAFKNGFVSGTGLTEHSRDHYCTLYFDSVFVEGAKCVGMESFLDTCFAGLEDADSRKRCLQQLVGNAVFGSPSELGLALYAHGVSRTGKSTFIKSIEALFPVEYRSAVKAGDIGDRRSMVAFRNSKVNVQNETGPKEIYKNAQMIKECITGEGFDSARVYEANHKINPDCFMMLASNHMIEAERLDSGLLNRFIFVGFPNVVPEGERVLGLHRELSGDSTGLLSWAYEGYRELAANGFKIEQPKSHTEIKNEWVYMSDHVLQFRNDCLQSAVDVDLPINQWVQQRSIYSAYKIWVDQVGLHPKERMKQIHLIAYLVHGGLEKKISNRGQVLKTIMKIGN